MTVKIAFLKKTIIQTVRMKKIAERSVKLKKNCLREKERIKKNSEKEGKLFNLKIIVGRNFLN